MAVYGNVLWTVDSHANAGGVRVPGVVFTFEALRYNVIGGFSVVPSDVCYFIQPRGVVDVTGDVHLFTSPEGYIGENG